MRDNPPIEGIPHQREDDMATKGKERVSTTARKTAQRKTPGRIRTVTFDIDQVKAIRIILGGEGVIINNPPRPKIEIDVVPRR
ncbi:hypothetical protein [Dokdonella fugitiva]|jgi:hypothetical protein|nr:hypothetical protein [Dokdonella fugitiva]MBA8883094.1 hypothetical protein [Dokdonella fugitiva]